MMSEAKLSPEQVEILKKPTFASVATVLPDGSPQVTLTWVDTDGESILINTSRGRLKERNLRRDPRVALAVFDPDDPYGRAFYVQGRAELSEGEGALSHINSLAKKYLGQDEYPWLQPGEVRVKVRILPHKVRNAT